MVVAVVKGPRHGERGILSYEVYLFDGFMIPDMK